MWAQGDWIESFEGDDELEVVIEPQDAASNFPELSDHVYKGCTRIINMRDIYEQSCFRAQAESSSEEVRPVSVLNTQVIMENSGIQ